MLKIKPIQKPFFSETIETHFMYYVSHVLLLTNSEQQSKVKLDHVGPHYSQNKQGEHTIFRHGNTVVSMLDLSFCDHRSRERFRRSARRNDATQ
jgi:hypothetical protein